MKPNGTTGIPSPFLTPEQEQERDRAKNESFIKEYNELCTKHGREYIAILNASFQGILPSLAIAEKIKQSQHENNNTNSPSQ